MGSSKKESADSRTIRKSTREASIDTLQAASISSVNQLSNDTIQLVLDNNVHHSTVHSRTVHHGIVHPGTLHQGIVHRGTVYLPSIDNVHPVSIDIVNPALIDIVHPASIDNVHSVSIDTFHSASIHTVYPALTNIVHRDTVHHDTVHCDIGHPNIVDPVKNDTTCGETEKIEVLILRVNENGMLRDEEGRIRNSA